MNDGVQKSLWAVEQEILDVIHNVCSKYGLKYSLAYGSLLGAVRHGGFIPWDDDLDIMMPREDYEKLLSIWDSVAPDGYILLNGIDYDDYPNVFSKIVKDHTTFLQDEEERSKSFHKGIFVDIFPADRVAKGRIARKIQYALCAINLLYNRGYTSGTGGLIGMVERILLNVPERIHPTLEMWTEKRILSWNKSCDSKWFIHCTISASKRYFPDDTFDHLILMNFNGKQYLAVGNYDAWLTKEYGDYMQFPPEAERVWKHHPLLIDFEHNYGELEH